MKREENKKESDKTKINKITKIILVSFLFLSPTLAYGADRYWVGGGSSANWDATGPTNWSTTAGGSNNASVPTSADDVYFTSDSSSASTLSQNISIKSLDMNGYTGTLTHNSSVTLTIVGYNSSNRSLRFSDDMTYVLGNSISSAINFTGTVSNLSITTAGKNLGSVTFNGVGGEWTIVDSSTSIKGNLTMTAGTLLGSGDITVESGSVSGDGVIIMTEGESIDTPYILNVNNVSIGSNHTCAVTNLGNLYCWGHNNNGQLGDNTSETNRLVPIRVLRGGASAVAEDNDGTYLINVKEVSAGYIHTCAVTNSGNLYCWGINSYGRTGINNDIGNSLTPVRVLRGEASLVNDDNNGTNIINVAQVSAGDSHTCAVTNSGNLYCWGNNTYGVVGDNTSGDSKLTPVRVLRGEASQVETDNDGTYIANVAQVSSGNYGLFFSSSTHTCAVTNSGNLYCWGENNGGRTGIGVTTGSSLTPVRVLRGQASQVETDNDGTYLTNMSKVSAGGDHVCAFSDSGNLYCWGWNFDGAIPINQPGGSYNVPQRALRGEASEVGVDNDGTYLTNVKDVSSGSNHTCAVTNSNNVYCSGINVYGELGNIDEVDRSLILVRVLRGEASEVGVDNDGTNLININQIYAGVNNSCAVTVEGNLYCWGLNTNGQVGDDTSGTNRFSSIRVLSGLDFVDTTVSSNFRVLGEGFFGGDLSWTFDNLIFGNGTDVATTTSSGIGTTTVSRKMTISANHIFEAEEKTFDLEGVGNIFVKSGTFVASSSKIIISDQSGVAKNFDGGSSTYNDIVFSGDNITVSGSNTFNNFEVNNAALTTGLKITSGTTQNISNITSNGGLGNLTKISASTASGATLNKVGEGFVCLDYVNISWITGTPSDIWYVGGNSTNGGNNSNLTFSDCPGPINLSGILYTTRGGASAGQNININVYKNGESLGSAVTNLSGVWSLEDYVQTDDVITVYVSNDSIKSNTILISDGNSKSDVNLYGNTLIIRNDSGINITNANLHTGAIYGETDMVFATSTSNSITLNSNIDLHIWTGDTYAPGGNITTQGTGGIYIDTGSTATLNNTATIAGNVVVNSTGTLNGSGNITINGGSLTGDGTVSNTGTLILGGTGNFGGTQNWTFNQLTFGTGTTNTTTATGAGSITTATTTIALNQTLNAGSKTWNLTSTEPLIVLGTLTPSSSTFNYLSNEDAVIASTTFYNLNITPSSGNPTYYTLGNNPTITVNNNINMGGVGNIILDLNTNDTTLVVGNNLTIGSGDTLSAPSINTITVGGDFANNGTFTHNNGEVIFNTTKTATITSISNMSFYNLTVLSPGKTIQFNTHTNDVPTFSFANQFVVTGVIGNPIFIYSNNQGNQWLANFLVPQTSITYAYVRDSACALGSYSVASSNTNSSGGNNGECFNIENQGADGSQFMYSIEMGVGSQGVLRTGGSVQSIEQGIGGESGGGDLVEGGGPSGGGGGMP
jgi:alpha-tubulin suppressor-like RCC1 family protein